MTDNERLAYRLALQTAVKACQIARTLLEDTEDYADLHERIEGAEVELSDMSTLYPASQREGDEMVDSGTKQITSEEAFNLLHLPENQTQFFSGSYAKLDGTIRTFNGRRKVTKHLRGGELKYDPSTRGNVIYWDRNAYVEGKDEGYRTIRTDDLLNLRIGKQDYIIVNPPKVEIHYDAS